MCTHTFNATEQGVVIRVGFEPTVVPRWTDPLEVFSLTVTDILGLSVESSLAADCSTGICAYVPHRVAQLYRGEAVEVTWRITNSSVATPYAFARWLTVNSSEPTMATGYPYPEHVCDAGAMAGTAELPRLNLSESITGAAFVSSDGFVPSYNVTTDEFEWSTTANLTAEAALGPVDREFAAALSIITPPQPGLHHLVWYEYTPCDALDALDVKHVCNGITRSFEPPAGGSSVEHCLVVRTSLAASIMPEELMAVEADATMNFGVSSASMSAVAAAAADISGTFAVVTSAVYQDLTVELTATNQFAPEDDSGSPDVNLPTTQFSALLEAALAEAAQTPRGWVTVPSTPAGYRDAQDAWPSVPVYRFNIQAQRDLFTLMGDASFALAVARAFNQISAANSTGLTVNETYLDFEVDCGSCVGASTWTYSTSVPPTIAETVAGLWLNETGYLEVFYEVLGDLSSSSTGVPSHGAVTATSARINQAPFVMPKLRVAVRVATGDRFTRFRPDWTADTEAGVFVSLHGSTGRTGEAELNAAGARFALSAVEDVSVSLELFAGLLADIGTLQRVDLRVNGTDGWHAQQFHLSLPDGQHYEWVLDDFWINEDMCEDWTNEEGVGCTRSLYTAFNCTAFADEQAVDVTRCVERPEPAAFFQCTDIDECATFNGGCISDCYNSLGGFSCGDCPNTTALGPGRGITFDYTYTVPYWAQVKPCGKDDLLAGEECYPIAKMWFMQRTSYLEAEYVYYGPKRPNSDADTLGNAHDTGIRALTVSGVASIIGCEAACSENTKLVYGQRHECLGFSWEEATKVCKYFFLYKVPLAAGNCTPANAFLDLEDCFTPSALPGTFLRVGAPGGALLNTLAAPPEVCYNTVGGFTCGVNDALAVDNYGPPWHLPEISDHSVGANMTSPYGMSLVEAQEYRRRFWAAEAPEELSSVALVDVGLPHTVGWDLTPEMDVHGSTVVYTEWIEQGLAFPPDRFTVGGGGPACNPSLGGRTDLFATYHLPLIDRERRVGAVQIATPRAEGNYSLLMYQQVDCASDHALPNCTHLDENNQEVCVAVRAVQHVEAVNYTLKYRAEFGGPVSLHSCSGSLCLADPPMRARVTAGSLRDTHQIDAGPVPIRAVTSTQQSPMAVAYPPVCAQVECNETYQVTMPNSNTLFISEYLEGTSAANRYIEIYNPTCFDVNLGSSQVKIWQISGGGDWAEGAGNAISLSGTIVAGETYVVCDDGAPSTIKDFCDLETGDFKYNGDDAIGLSVFGVLVDAIGEEGADPGLGFDVGTELRGTKDKVLRRVPYQLTGQTDWAAVQTTLTVLGPTDFTDLHLHTSDLYCDYECVFPPPPPPPVSHAHASLSPCPA